ncbi:MAG: winged helix DNA-binding domain-containing protein [Thermoleophilaceae bacterium]|nr:winged helix DNA-binding domain-containing protein [Thermoleophilaceae bacterium]
MIEQLRRFTYARQMLGRSAAGPAEALRAVAGVYSSHPSGPLSLSARSKSFSAKAYEELDHVRVPAFRGSIHIVAPESAELALGLTKETEKQRDYRLKYMGFTRAQYEDLKPKIRKAAQNPRTAAELREDVGLEKRVSAVLGGMNREGLLVRVGSANLRSNALRYQAARLKPAAKEKSHEWAAGEYLRAFGPARVRDFAWWAPASAREAAAAFDAHGAIDVGEGYFLRPEDRDAFEGAQAVRGDRVDVIPKWDCLTMGYPKDGRERFLHPELYDRAYDFRGDGRGLMLAAGQAVGAWEGRFGSKPGIELDWFEKPGAKLKAAVEKGFDEVRALLS